MSARLLLAVAVVCFVATVSAQTIITRNLFLQAGCTGDIFSKTNFTSGACTPSSGGYESSAMYASASGDKVYTYLFSDRNCTGTAAYQIQSASANQCGAPGSNQYSYTVVNPSAGPAAPQVFPPSGWATTTRYFNVSNNRGASNCAAGTGIIQIDGAVLLGSCRRVDSSFGTLAYTGTYCLSGSTAKAGSAVFSSSTCSADSVFQAQVADLNVCRDGSITGSCPDSAPSFPAVPTMGYVAYSNEDCTSSNPSTLYTTSTCYQSSTFVCGAINGTMSATISNFVDTTNKGLCTAPATRVSSFIADGTTCFNGKKYNCAFPQPEPASASSFTASSVIVMMVAAVVAVFATRSL